MHRKILLIGAILMIITFSGCVSVEIIGSESDNTYSREYVADFTSSASFGKGRMDDIYVALDYIYSNAEIKEKYGTEFDIALEDIVCNNSEGETFFFKSVYKGVADYSVKILNDVYRIQLDKSYFSEWNVVEFYLDD